MLINYGDGHRFLGSYKQEGEAEQRMKRHVKAGEGHLIYKVYCTLK